MRVAILLILSAVFSLNYYTQGETCDTAEEITIDGAFTADGPGTGNGCFTCPGSAENADWYTFTPSADIDVAISSCSDGIDTHFYVYDGDCLGLSMVAANDDAGCGTGGGFASYAEFSVTGGTQYFVEWVDHWSAADFDWSLESISCAIPGNLYFDNLTDQGADIHWESSNVGVTYEIEYGEIGFTPGEGTVETGSVIDFNMTVTLQGLTSGTSYEVYLTEICDAGTATPSAINFNTFIDLAPNDLCANAIEIACGDVINATTFNSTIDVEVPNCAGTEIDANGIWYHFMGVDGMIKASTCGVSDYDTRVFVYSGACDDLVCVGANDDDFGCTDLASSAHFPAQAGVDYWILVHGFEGEYGDFPLTLTCDAVCEPVPANGACDVAEIIVPTDSCAYVETTNSCASINFVNPECSPFLETEDIWYGFNSGSNTTIALNIVLGDALQIGASIYPACGSTPLICVDEVSELLSFGVMEDTDYVVQFWSTFDDAGSFEFCISTETCLGPTNIESTPLGGGVVSINWNSVNTGLGFVLEYGEVGFVQGEGTTMNGEIGVGQPPVMITGLDDGNTYEVYILENCSDGQVISGPISFTSQVDAPENDECPGALSIPSCEGEIDGTTLNATIDSSLIECDGINVTSPGVWYTMDVIASTTYTISTCDESTFDSQISVYSGSCDNYSCIAANDDGIDCVNGSSEVVFTGFEGTVWVLVSGANGETGDFSLSTSCATGIDELNIAENFTIVPNPSTGIFQIMSSNRSLLNNATISIFDAQGVQVHARDLSTKSDSNTAEFDLGHLATGLYHVRITNEEGSVSKKIIIK